MHMFKVDHIIFLSITDKDNTNAEKNIAVFIKNGGPKKSVSFWRCFHTPHLKEFKQ